MKSFFTSTLVYHYRHTKDRLGLMHEEDWERIRARLRARRHKKSKLTPEMEAIIDRIIDESMEEIWNAQDEGKNTMKVKDLIKALKTCNPNEVVVMSSDAEGNSYSKLGELSIGMFTPNRFGTGDISLRELTPELEKEGCTQEDVGDPKKGALHCVILSPM